MSDAPDWLPPLQPFAAKGGDWKWYVEILYDVFRKDFLVTPPQFRGLPVRIKRLPFKEEKEAGFWHLISEGEVEQERDADLDRCARIGWLRPMLEAVDTDRVKWWMSVRGTLWRYVIALPDFSYVVILDDRDDHVYLWTAYCVKQQHRRRKLAKECEAYWKSQKN